MEAIVNRVEQSGLIQFSLEDYYPKAPRTLIDLKEQLWQGLILKEKDFRNYISTHNWENYRGHYVAVTCSADAVIPVWAYMLVSAALQPFVQKVVMGSLVDLEKAIFHDIVAGIDVKQFTDQRIIIKGCSKYPVPHAAYLDIVQKLRPVAKSIMYGEACSTVPVFKKIEK